MRKPASKLVVTRGFGCIPEAFFPFFLQTSLLWVLAKTLSSYDSKVWREKALASLFWMVAQHLWRSLPLCACFPIEGTVPLKAAGNAGIQRKSIIQSPTMHRDDKELFFIFWAFWEWWWCRKRYLHNWQLKNALLEVRERGGQKITNHMVLSVVTFCGKIVLNSDVSKSTVSCHGWLGGLKEKQAAEKTTNRQNTLYYSAVAILLPYT